MAITQQPVEISRHLDNGSILSTKAAEYRKCSATLYLSAENSAVLDIIARASEQTGHSYFDAKLQGSITETAHYSAARPRTALNHQKVIVCFGSSKAVQGFTTAPGGATKERLASKIEWVPLC